MKKFVNFIFCICHDCPFFCLNIIVLLEYHIICLISICKFKKNKKIEQKQAFFNKMGIVPKGVLWYTEFVNKKSNKKTDEEGVFAMKKEEKNKTNLYVKKIELTLDDVLNLGLKNVDSNDKYWDLQARKQVLTNMVYDLQMESVETYKNFTKQFSRKAKRLGKSLRIANGLIKELSLEGVIVDGKFDLHKFVEENPVKYLPGQSAEAQDIVLLEKMMTYQKEKTGQISEATKKIAVENMIRFNKNYDANAKKYVCDEINDMQINHLEEEVENFMLHNATVKYKNGQGVYTTPYTYSSLVKLESGKKVAIFEDEKTADTGMVKELK